MTTEYERETGREARSYEWQFDEARKSPAQKAAEARQRAADNRAGTLYFLGVAVVIILLVVLLPPGRGLPDDHADCYTMGRAEVCY